MAVVVVRIVEGTWPACVDAAGRHAPEDAEIVLLHITGHDVADAAHGAFAGLLGRGHPERDPGTRVEHLAAASAETLLQAAADRLGRACTRIERTGRAEHEVIAATTAADLLVLARDGDRTRLGPHGLAPAGRFVVDHAPCPLLLVWPEPSALTTLPPAPPRPPA